MIAFCGLCGSSPTCACLTAAVLNLRPLPWWFPQTLPLQLHDHLSCASQGFSLKKGSVVAAGPTPASRWTSAYVFISSLNPAGFCFPPFCLPALCWLSLGLYLPVAQFCLGFCCLSCLYSSRMRWHWEVRGWIEDLDSPPVLPVSSRDRPVDWEG